jgi:hypothetical protein
VQFNIPMGEINEMLLKETQLRRELATIEDFKAFCSKYAPPGELQQIVSGGYVAPISTTNPVTPSAPIRANNPNGPRAQEAALEALNTYGTTGATASQIEGWIKMHYPALPLLPHHISVALNRAWNARKCGANGAVGKGLKPTFYGLEYLPQNVNMAPQKAQQPQQQAATG